VVGDVRGRGHDVDDPREVLRASGAFQVAELLELLPDGQRVGGVALVAQPLNRLEDQTMAGMIEVVGDQLLHRVIGRGLLDQHAAQHGDLGLVAVGGHPVLRV
jgi:hypothetical protein